MSTKSVSKSVHISFIHNSPKLEDQLSINRSLDKPWHIHTVKYYSSMKRNQQHGWMNPQNMLSEQKFHKSIQIVQLYLYEVLE